MNHYQFIIQMVGSPVQYDETIDGLEGFREKKKQDKVDANLWVYLSKTVKGAMGWAWLGSLCDPGDNQVSITHADKNNMLWASEIVTHEMGHNLGMSHDFNDKTPRYFKGEDCDCQGLESYCSFPPLKWSECSRNDFLAHFNAIGESKWCLESKLNLTVKGHIHCS